MAERQFNFESIYITINVFTYMYISICTCLFVSYFSFPFPLLLPFALLLSFLPSLSFSSSLLGSPGSARRTASHGSALCAGAGHCVGPLSIHIYIWLRIVYIYICKNYIPLSAKLSYTNSVHVTVLVRRIRGAYNATCSVAWRLQQLRNVYICNGELAAHMCS